MVACFAFFLNIGAIGVILSAIGKPNLWVGISAIYLILDFFIYYHSNSEEKERKDREIAELNSKIKNLEDSLQWREERIKQLESELENNNETNNI